MQRLFKNLFGQLKEFYMSLTPIKRMSLLVTSLIVFTSFIILLMMTTRTDYAVLLKDVPPENLSLVLSQLSDKNVPYKLVEDGYTVVVPKAMLHATQMSIMADLGSNRIGSVGLELFEKQDFGTTSYAQRVNYQRALQGELMRAINTLDVVKQSKVLLALPAQKTFLEESPDPTASVVVDLHPNQRLSEEQVRGIAALVANSVENLRISNVTVVDAKGKVLSREYDPAVAGSSQLMEIQGKVERQLEQRIQEILGKTVGTGNVIAKVNVNLNPRKTHTLEELVDPDRTAVRSVQTEEERLNGARTNPAGVPGARANLPGAEDAGQVGFNQNIRKEINTTNYSVPKTVRNITQSAGAIERISVAVLVDGMNQTVTGEDGQPQQQWTPRTEEELAKFETLVKNAIGFNENRGDNVKIENMQFRDEDFASSEKLLTALERRKLIRNLAWWALLGFSILLFFFAVIRPFIRWLTDSFQVSVDDMLPRTIEELEELQAVDNTLPGMSGALPVLEESLDPNKAEAELLKERITALMEKDEEKAANALGLWFVRRDL